MHLLLVLLAERIVRQELKIFMKMPRQSFLVAKHEHENLSKQSAGLCQEEVAPLTPTYPTPSYRFPAPSTVTQRTAVGTKLCDMCISGAPRCVCVM